MIPNPLSVALATGAGAVWVVGNAPTALAEVIALNRRGDIAPAVVIGLPVGYVGAADAKAAIRRSSGANDIAERETLILGVEPAMTAGHSYGELVALCAAGSLT